MNLIKACTGSVVMMPYSSVRNLWLDTMNTFSESVKDLTTVLLINCLSLWHNSLRITPWLSKKQISMDLIFNFLILAFFGLCELLMCHSKLSHLVSGSYSKIHDSSPVMTCLKKFCHFWHVQEDPGTHSFSFPLVCWWGFLEPSLHKFSACPIPR